MKIEHKLDDQDAENSHGNSLSGYFAQFLELSQLSEPRTRYLREMQFPAGGPSYHHGKHSAAVLWPSPSL